MRVFCAFVCTLYFLIAIQLVLAVPMVGLYFMRRGVGSLLVVKWSFLSMNYLYCCCGCYFLLIGMELGYVTAMASDGWNGWKVLSWHELCWFCYFQAMDCMVHHAE